METAPLALQYEALLRKRGMRPDTLRLRVLSVLAGEENFFDVTMLAEKLAAAGVNCERERVRYVVKRLGAAGLLEKKPVPKKNKNLFRLWSLESLDGYSTH
jgi:Fe2+ or Zn2+ uptake regulation protein